MLQQQQTILLLGLPTGRSAVSNPFCNKFWHWESNICLWNPLNLKIIANPGKQAIETTWGKSPRTVSIQKIQNGSNCRSTLSPLNTQFATHLLSLCLSNDEVLKRIFWILHLCSYPSVRRLQIFRCICVHPLLLICKHFTFIFFPPWLPLQENYIL